MVKDKHAKAVAFMAKMKFTDSCIGYDAGESNVTVLKIFLVKRLVQWKQRNFFQHFP